MNQDITFCWNCNDCKLKENCKRNKKNAKGEYTSYANFYEKDKKCNYFMEYEKTKH